MTRAGGHTARIRIEMPDRAAAEQARRAIEADNGDFLTAYTDGKHIVLDAEADSPLGLLRTIEDALTCLRATGLAP
jgi:hypothetical protein